MATSAVTIVPLHGLPHVGPGDDLVALICRALAASAIHATTGDILVVTQKIVSKAEGRIVDLATVTPTPRAVELAGRVRKDARLVEVILREAVEVVRAAPHVLIVRTRAGLVMANAGIDQSNLARDSVREPVLLLPEDPDRSAASFKAGLDTALGLDLGVIISDSVGRAWRLGTVGLAIGAAGVPALWDRRGELDLSGRRLEVTEVAFADAVAAAAVLAMGEAAEGAPVALVRGLRAPAPPRPASALIRPLDQDLFR